jgi:TrmH family RNA methyltransferase
LFPIMVDRSDFDSRLRRIDSRQNTRVKELRRAFADGIRNQQDEVAIEGMHLVEEAIRSGLKLSTVFLSESARERVHKLLPQLSSHTETLLLPDSVFASAVPTETPQGVAALVQVKASTLENILKAEPALLVLAYALQDPGNLGTICRSAEAFGVTGLLLGERTVSPWNWKAMRASAGSLFRLLAAKVELAAALPEIKSRGIHVLIIGNEGAGVPKDVLAQADETVAIPQASSVESLNAGIAASILLYEAARQRKASQPQRHGGTEV